MSTYWKVVNKAYVFWDYLSLWDTLCLNLDIGSRVSILSPDETVEAGVEGALGDSLGFSVLGAYFGASLEGCWVVWAGLGV